MVRVRILDVSSNSMRILQCGLLFMYLLSCQNEKVKTNIPTNDTIRVLEIALREGTSEKYMPSASALQRKYRFGDSIFLTSPVLPISILPISLNGSSFKTMNVHEICLTIISDSALQEVPNYLSISRFENNDTAYYVQVQSLSCRPYGGGGSLGLSLKKIKDSFIVINRGPSSIN